MMRVSYKNETIGQSVYNIIIISSQLKKGNHTSYINSSIFELSMNKNYYT